MKNLLLLLILANVLYFMWGMFTTEEQEPGVAVVEETDLGPPLQVTAGKDNESIASVGAVLGSGEPSDLEAVVGRSCVTIGPFKVIGDADSAALQYSDEGMKTALRKARGQIFVGHSVQIEDVASRQDGREIVSNLGEQGLGDAFVVGNDETEPAKMQRAVSEENTWRARFELVDPEKSTLRLALELSGSVFFAETPAVFIDYDTSFSRENFSE